MYLIYQGYFGEESSASTLRIVQMCLGSLRKNLLPPPWGFIREESFSFLLGMMLDVLELLRKNLLLSHGGSVLDMLDPLGKNLMLLPWG